MRCVAVTVEGTTRPRLSLAVLSLVLFVTFLDNTIVAATLADIQTSLHAGIDALQWVVSSYALVFAALMLTFGTLGDHLGRRRVMLLGLAVFTLGSIVSSAAVTSGMLIGGRVIMGIGAAASEPGTLSMLRQLYPDRAERAQALGVWSAVSGLALASGPVVGGVLVGVWSWRAVFVFNVAIGIIAMAGVGSILPEFVTPQRRRFDIPGFVLGASAITAGTFATILGETHGYSTWWIVLLYAVAAGALVLFIGAERRADEPVLDLRFFRSRPFLAGNALAFTGYFSTFSVFFFVPLYLELLGNTSSYKLAVEFVPMAASMIAASALAGLWISRSGPGSPMVAGCVLAGIGILLTNLFITPSSGVELFGWSLPMVGAGLGVVMVAATVSVLGVVPAERSGMAASSVNTSRQLGAVAGVAVLGAIVSTQITSNLQNRCAAIPGTSHSACEQAIVAITTGNLPSHGPLIKLIDLMIPATVPSFNHGIDLVLSTACALMLASALLGGFLVRRWRAGKLDR